VSVDAFARRIDHNAGVTLADATACGAAVADVLERRLDGETRSAMILFEEPRRMVLRTIAASIKNDPARDSRMQTLAGLAAGNLTLNGQPQNQYEHRLFPAGADIAFWHLGVAADRILVRSLYELDAICSWFGVRPTRTALYSPADPSVPAPAGTVAATACLALWAEGIDDGTLDIVLDVLATVRLPLKVVRADATDAATVLASARAIVSLSSDPATAIALARFARPLCAATPGALEVLDGVQVFDICNPTSTVDAVLRAIGSAAPVERPEAAFRTTMPGAPANRSFGADAPLVSIVMCVYNRLENLRRNLARLQRQTYPNVEIVVVSNGGPRADDICAAFPNVRYLHRETNSGDAAAPRNDGIKIARGEYVCMLDDDDFYFPEHIARMVARACNGARVIYSDFAVGISETLADGGERYAGYDIEKGDGITTFELLVTNRIGYMTIFAHRDVYVELGAFDLEGAKGNEEVDLWLRMASHYPIAHSDQVTTLYTIRRNWVGSLTAVSHHGFAEGYERVYARYPIEGLPGIAQMRVQHLARLRSTDAPPREPRYPAIRGIA
jgi:hypothetical protein